LTGIVHEYQQFNNCGPANLAMALSFWGWQGDQRDTRAYLRPRREVDDKNVNPAEMVAFVEQFTGLDALARVGGDLDLLRRLLAAGFPVLIEAGHHPPKDWWMGHYLVVSGYDDQQRLFTVQDSLANPDLPLSYDELEARWWRDFNYVYLVIYPPERQAELAQILGERLDEDQSYRLAEQKALEEISTLQGRDLFFAWFNLGSSRVGLGDYTGAAQAFDQAFELYQGLSEDQRPYRLLWYQDTPYRAYYNSGRYQDVVDLANITFSWVGQPVLEESYYWRGMAYLALGMQPRAVADFTKAASLNPNFTPPRQELERLGEPIP
jgi:tetratricopeptide (TPR) repeat protein